jgi:hypothetical protein
MRIARSMSARRAVRRFVNRLGVQLSSSANSAHVRSHVRRSSFSAVYTWFRFHRSRLSVPARGNLTSPTSVTRPAKKSSGARRSHRNMNSAYWQEVVPRCDSRTIAPGHSERSILWALSLDDCCHRASARAFQSNPRSRRWASSALKSAPQSKTGRAGRTRVSLPKSRAGLRSSGSATTPPETTAFPSRGRMSPLVEDSVACASVPYRRVGDHIFNET